MWTGPKLDTLLEKKKDALMRKGIMSIPGFKSSR